MIVRYRRPDWHDWVVIAAQSAQEAERLRHELRRQGYIVE